MKKEFLAPSISGDRVACLGVSEAGAGSDVASRSYRVFRCHKCLKLYIYKGGNSVNTIYKGGKQLCKKLLFAFRPLLDFWAQLFKTNDVVG